MLGRVRHVGLNEKTQHTLGKREASACVCEDLRTRDKAGGL